MTVIAQPFTPIPGSPAGKAHAACVAVAETRTGKRIAYGPFESAPDAAAFTQTLHGNTGEVHTLYGSEMTHYLSHQIAFAWDLLDTSFGIEVVPADAARIVCVTNPVGDTTVHGPFRDDDVAAAAAAAFQDQHPDSTIEVLVLHDLDGDPVSGPELVTVLCTLTDVSKVLRLAVIGFEGLGISEHGTVECTDCNVHTPFLDLTTHWCPETGADHDYTEL